MKDLSIKMGLTLVLGIMVLMIGVISGLGFYSNNTSSSAINELDEINVRQVNTINRSQINLSEGRSSIVLFRDYVRQGMDEKAAEEINKVKEAFAQSQIRFAEFMGVELPEGSQRLPYVNAIKESYRQTLNDALLEAVNRADLDDIFAQSKQFNEGYAALSTAVQDFIHYAELRGDELIAGNAELSQTVTVAGLVLSVLALLIALAVRIGLMRMVVEPLQHAGEHFERIADGDLTARIEDRGTNEIGQLFVAMKAMQEQLRQLVLSLRSSSESVFTGAGEISMGSQDLSTRTEEQASALQETASSMEQMTSIVRHNTETAGEANQLAASAAKAAETGGQEVERTVLLMREIAEGSRKVNDIVKLIDSIAFQTNILALNASVEAARAGEQGRGFAVVANEVRSLASRSADSAKEIRAMIEQITTQVSSGAEQAERSGETINDTVMSIRQVSSLMNEISTAAREQNGGIEQINVAVTQMDSVTQQNAALVEQTSAAAASLEDQSRRLAELIAMFRVDDQLYSSQTVSNELSRRAPLPVVSQKAVTTSNTQNEEWGTF